MGLGRKEITRKDVTGLCGPPFPFGRAEGDVAIEDGHCIFVEDRGVLFSSGSSPNRYDINVPQPASGL